MKCEKCKKKEYEHLHHIKFNKKTGKSDKDSKTQKLCTLCHAKIHGIEPKRSELKDNVVKLNRNQKSRIVIDNQIRGFGRIELKSPDYYLKIKEILVEEEKKLVKEIKCLLENKGDHLTFAKTHNHNVSFPIYPWLKNIRGMGPLNSAYLIAYIDIEKTPSVSALWCYTGQTPDSKRTKGVKANWNPVIKQRCFQIAGSFLKSKSPYKKIYDEDRRKSEKLMENDHNDDAKTHIALVTPSIPKSKMHAHKRAMRKMVKSFLKDMWVEWNNIQKKETKHKVLKPKRNLSPSDDKLK